MKEKEYLDLLRYYLRKLPDNVIDDIIADYEEHFRLGKEAGKSEGLIAAELGSPMEIARDFKATDYYGPKGQEEKGAKTGSLGKALVLLLLVLLMSPVLLILASVVFGLFMAFGGILFAFVVSCGTIGAAVLSLPFGGFPFVNFGSAQGWVANLHPLTQVLLGLFFLSLCFLCIPVIGGFFKVAWRGLKNLFLSLKWSYRKWRYR